jgi:hypothetical protein
VQFYTTDVLITDQGLADGHLTGDDVVLRVREELYFVCLDVKLWLHVPCFNTFCSKTRYTFCDVWHNFVSLYLLAVHRALVYAKNIDIILLQKRLALVYRTKPIFLIAHHQALVYYDRAFPEICNWYAVQVVVVYFTVLNPFKKFFDFVLQNSDRHWMFRRVNHNSMFYIPVKFAIGDVNADVW